MANKANDSFNKKLLQIVGNEETAAKVLELIEEHKQQEKEVRRLMQMKGIKKAKENGVALGRPKISLPENFTEICIKYKEGKLTAQDGASLCNMGVSTFYRRIRDFEEQRIKAEMALI